MSDRFEFVVPADFHRFRLDDFLYAKFPYLGRMYLRELVRDGKCDVNGAHENRGRVLKHGDFVEVVVDRARRTSLHPEPIPITVIFEDDDLLVVDKPAGMLIHPTVGVRTGTLLNAVAHHFGGGYEENFIRAGLVHRLDKDTSGVVLIAKNLRSHRILARHFQRKLVEKRYLALVDGVVGPDSGEIEAPIGRYAEQRLWAVKADGKPSVSKFRVIRRDPDRTLVGLEPVTGRTNQLRIHLAHVGHPIAGDAKYGGSAYGRLCLHAHRLRINHPASGEKFDFVALPPPEMEKSGE